jgi:hypothetical protein
MKNNLLNAEQLEEVLNRFKIIKLLEKLNKDIEKLLQQITLLCLESNNE